MAEIKLKRITYNDNKLEGYQHIDKNVTYAEDSTIKGSDFYGKENYISGN